MALRAMTVSLPVEMGCAEHEFTPKFNAKNSMFEFRHADKVVAVGLTLDEVEASLQAWAKNVRETAAAAAAPRDPVLIIRHATSLAYGIGSYVDAYERHPPEHLLAFSATPAFRSDEGLLYRDAVGDSRCEGGQKVIPDTPAAREFAQRVTERMSLISDLISQAVDDKPLEELPAIVPDLPTLGHAVIGGEMIVPGAWDVPHQKKDNGASRRGSDFVSEVKFTVFGNEERRDKRFRIVLDETTGQFCANHPKGFKVPGHSTGRSVSDCKRHLEQNVEEHNARVIFEEGRHLLSLRTLVTNDARSQRLERPFPQKTPAPDTVVAMTYEHVWAWGGLFWRPAWSDYESVVDLKKRGQINPMIADGVSDSATYVDWSPQAESRLVAAQDGIAQINDMLDSVIQAGFKVPEPEDRTALPSSEM